MSDDTLRLFASTVLADPRKRDRRASPERPAPNTHSHINVFLALARLACAERRNGAPCRCEADHCATARADAKAWLDGGMQGRIAGKARDA